jgi:hypothetical protein
MNRHFLFSSLLQQYQYSQQIHLRMN